MSKASTAKKRSWAGRECPVEGCQQRYLSADAAGRHLDRVHDEAGRWQANRYRAVDGVDGDDVVIYDVTDGHCWIQSSYAVEVAD